MAPKLVTVLLLFFLVAAIPCAQSSEADNWATSKKFPKKTVTKLHAIRVAQAAGTQKSPTLFGLVMMADDPLTKTVDPNSELVGRAQGLYGSAGQQELGLIMAMNYGFTHGIYNGSSVSLLGKNPSTHPVREMAIVGGTGLFRFARGYAIAQTHWFDTNTGDAIVGYNVTVVN
ncbi:hypothetical protein I3842_06G124600 [Carya illinoinensis]|uniref:Dirigent protein n=1 Tax=Carya illinoinensis TaxID=32201 RepID=A0A922EWT6_CARIL|nr:hypothetical protein I3842_Q080900 [Carya illinoinensis]KAG6709278.1 hypothetical protein I3842_06G124600 [Carya illinoinensis]